MSLLAACCSVSTLRASSRLDRLPAAQFAFDRGLTMFFAYQPEEAEVAFREAARLDPGLAMAWWGVGLAIGPNINEEPTPEKTVEGCRGPRPSQLARKARATTAELDYVNALSVRYTTASEPGFRRAGHPVSR